MVTSATSLDGLALFWAFSSTQLDVFLPPWFLLPGSSIYAPALHRQSDGCNERQGLGDFPVDDDDFEPEDEEMAVEEEADLDDLAEDELGDVLGDDLDEDALSELGDDDDLVDDELVDDDLVDDVLVDEIEEEVAPVVRPASDDEDEDEDELDPDDVEASLDDILKDRLVIEEVEVDDEEEAEVDDRNDGSSVVAPKRPDEFVCQSCFLVKHPSQLADKARTLCRDCV